jgi:hypothetical protein
MEDCELALCNNDDDFELAANWVMENEKKAENK